MFSSVNFTIINPYGFTPRQREGIIHWGFPLFESQLEKAEQLAGYHINASLQVNIIAATGYAGRAMTDDYKIEVGIPTKLEWHKMQRAVAGIFPHELAHSVFEHGTTFITNLPFIGRLMRPFRHHIEYRADGFAQAVNPDYINIQTAKYNSKLALNMEPGHDSNKHPAEIKRLLALRTNAYSAILERSLANSHAAFTQNKTFDSWTDYLKHRREYKAVQQGINDAADSLPIQNPGF